MPPASMATISVRPAIFDVKKMTAMKTIREKNEGKDKGYETDIVLRQDGPGRQTGFNKIIGLFTGIDHHRDHGKDQHHENGGGKDFAQYVPVDDFKHIPAQM